MVAQREGEVAENTLLDALAPVEEYVHVLLFFF